jgi:hexosaminidase
MKNNVVFIIKLVCLFFATTGSAATPAIIPAPQQMELGAGQFQLAPDTCIYVDFGSRETGRYLATKLRPSTGYKIKVALKLFPSRPGDNAILLTTKSANINLGPEGYELLVSSNAVVIRAPTHAGLFYGAQTLLQLFPPEIFSTNAVAGRVWQIPCVKITDWPRFPWRGMMLDVGRHFFDKREVERVLDEMALHKLNTFHWHLVDDQGWRIEIKKYPRLTQVGAWRSHSPMNVPETNHISPDWLKPVHFGPDGRYGGYYTQDDIREVVAFAAARHITIVPEIEMPGHSTAALAAYPQFSCTGGPYSTDTPAGVSRGVYCTGNDGTYLFLQDVLTEVFQLFPGKYIHIGGDEVPTDNWQHCPKDQAVIKREGLKDESQLESYFIRRMETFINAHGHTLIGWSEIREGGLAKSAVVMDWIGGAIEAASSGHDVVMTPDEDLYLDHYQSTNTAAEPRAIGGYLPLRHVYLYEPVPKDLPAQFDAHILGAQGNLWTEYVESLPYVEYMAFPRLCALAEVTWSSKSARDWDDFQGRLQTHVRRLDELGINYHPFTTDKK